MTIFLTYKVLLILIITEFCLLLLGLLWLYFVLLPINPCKIEEPYQQNQMINGCVMQKSNNQWIRTCG